LAVIVYTESPCHQNRPIEGQTGSGEVQGPVKMFEKHFAAIRYGQLYRNIIDAQMSMYIKID